MLNQQLHTSTPTVVVLDNRGSTIREINYCRHPDTINKTDERITRHHYHARGYLERSIDARLYKTQQSDSTIQANIQQVVSLGGLLSATKSVDSGNSVNISDIENKKVMDINGLGLVTEYHYTKPEFVSQLMAIMESSPTSKQILKERFTWGGADNKNIANNSVGKCTHHDFPAGRTEYGAYTLTGQHLIELRFITANTVKTPTHSQYQTRNIYDATGQLLKQIDAAGHEREWKYDRAGFLNQSSVQLQSDKKQLVIKAIDYSAAGQKLRVEHGNGIVTTYEYEAETQRLLHVKTQRPQGHALGTKIMQDLRYEYDPVGNIICLKNDAEATRYWRNQKIVPENRYVYDSLYQLVSATGRESANQKTPASMQSQSVTTLVKDAQSYTNYTRLYAYDRGGNLAQIRHNSAIAQQSFTQNICVSNKTNRALLETQQVAIEQIDQQFDALGNQKYLSTGDALQWDLRGTLAQVNKRGNSEHYVYASASQRLIKQQVQILSGRHIITETHYLPNLEIWQSTEGGHLTEHREVVDITGNVRALCWKVGFPKGIKNNQLRYSYDDGVGNSGLETDGQGQLVSYEEYYPYGGTAIWSSENAVEANYKTIRYSGKEKDATGMYYYGYRYYQPWIGRWLSADPAGTVDGLNLYRMVRNNPVTLRDPDGRAPEKPNGFAWVKGKDGEELNFAGMSLFAENENINAKAEYLAKEGIKAVVSLELEDYKLTRAALNAVNIDSIEFEISDWISPSMNQLYEYNQLLDKYPEYNVATYCWGGYGRTGIFLASRLIHTQEAQSAQEAMFLVREHYSEHAIEMKAQYNALARFADSYGLPASVSVSSLDFHWDSEHGNDGLEFDPGHNGDNTGISHPELDIFDLVLHASGAYNIETITRVNQKKESFSESESDEVINAQFLGDLTSFKINTQRRLSTSSL